MPIFERMMYITEAGDRRNNDTDYEEERYQDFNEATREIGEKYGIE